MSTIHIGSNENEIAKTVLMPGDPMRAKMIAEKYLKDAKLVNTVRGMTAWTGYYKDKLVTVFPSGMGMPSMGIYSYELFNFYGVEKIIRIGTCGANNPSVDLLDVILAESSYSLSTFPLQLGGETDKEYASSKELNDSLTSYYKTLESSAYALSVSNPEKVIKEI